MMITNILFIDGFILVLAYIFEQITYNCI